MIFHSFHETFKFLKIRKIIFIDNIIYDNKKLNTIFKSLRYFLEKQK
jgi:hypothetical protein